MTIDDAYLIQMRGALRHFCDAVGPLSQVHEGLPSATSKAVRERTIATRPESVVTAWALGAMQIEHSGQHLSAFLKVLTDPVEVLACWTCVRSMLESSALAAWLFDPSIDAYERVGRVFAHRYQGLQQQLKFARSIGIPESEIAKEVTRIDEMEKLVLQLGYPRVLNKKGKRNGLCRVMPPATDLVEQVLNEGFMYRLLSAVVHGHNWAIRPLGFEPVGQQADVGGVPITPHTPSIHRAGMALLGVSAMKAIARPLWHQCHYFGWNLLELEELFEKVADKLSMEVSTRFWRS